MPPTLAQPMTEFGEMTFEMFDLKSTSIGIDSYGFYPDMLFTHKNDSLDI